MGKLVHTCLGSSYLITHVLHCPPPPPAHSFIIGPAVINTHTRICVSTALVGHPAASAVGGRDTEEHGEVETPEDELPHRFTS